MIRDGRLQGCKKFCGKPFSSSFIYKTKKPTSNCKSSKYVPGKKTGMSLQNPVTPANDKYRSSLHESCELIGAVTGDKEFQPLTKFGRLKRRDGTEKNIKEAQLVLVILIWLIDAKMDEPILQVKCWVNVRIAIAVVRLYYRILRRAQVTITLQTQEQDWASGLGLGLAQ